MKSCQIQCHYYEKVSGVDAAVWGFLEPKAPFRATWDRHRIGRIFTTAPSRAELGRYYSGNFFKTQELK